MGALGRTLVILVASRAAAAGSISNRQPHRHVQHGYQIGKAHAKGRGLNQHLGKPSTARDSSSRSPKSDFSMASSPQEFLPLRIGRLPPEIG